MSQKSELIDDVVRNYKLISESRRRMNFRLDQYKDNGWTVGGASEITSQEIVDAGYQFTPAQLKACVDTTTDALDRFSNGTSFNPSDYDAKINAII